MIVDYTATLPTAARGAVKKIRRMPLVTKPPVRRPPFATPPHIVAGRPFAQPPHIVASGPLRGYVADPYLQTWTNGDPIGLGAASRSAYFRSWPNRTMGNYVSVPELQNRANGVKLVGTAGPGLSGYVDAPQLRHWLDGTQIDKTANSAKRDLVVMAFRRASAKKSCRRRGLRGLGIMVYDPTTDTYIDAGSPDTTGYMLPDTIDPTYYDPYPTNVDVYGSGSQVDTINSPLPTSIPYLTPPFVGTSSAGYPVSNYPATQQQLQNASAQGMLYNLLAPLANLFGAKSGTSQLSYPTTAAAVQPASLATSLQSSMNSLSSQLSQRPFASVPITYGGLLLLGGGAIVLTSLLGSSTTTRRRR